MFRQGDLLGGLHAENSNQRNEEIAIPDDERYINMLVQLRDPLLRALTTCSIDINQKRPKRPLALLMRQFTRSNSDYTVRGSE